MKFISAAIILLFSFNPALRAQDFSSIVFNPNYAGTFPQNITNFQGTLFFSALIDTFGTQLGFFSNNQAYGGAVLNPLGSSNPQGFTAYKGNLYFQADNGPSAGAELWTFISSSSTLKMLNDIDPGPLGSYPNSFIVCDTLLFFVAYDSTHGNELWVTNGDSANTHLVTDILPGRSGSNPTYLTVLNNKLYFQANDSIHGPELWVSDGTDTGTQLLQDINATDTTGSFPAYLSVYNNKLYFQANNGINGNVLWSTDGTAAGTQLISPTAAQPQNFTAFSGKLYFQASDTMHGNELWVTDGTEANTQWVSDINAGTNSSNPQNFIVYNNKLYFQADDSVHGPELWVTDGTGGGTTLVADIYPGPTGSYPQYPIVYNGKLFFAASDSLHGAEMFSYNGIDTPVLVIPSDTAYSGPLAATGGFTLFNGALAFSAEYDSTGQELWFYGPQILAINNVEAENNVKIYPNPFIDGFNITGLDAGKNYTVQLVDVSGREISQQQTLANGGIFYFQSPALAAGIYLLQIQSGDNLITRKLVKTTGQ